MEGLNFCRKQISQLEGKSPETALTMETLTQSFIPSQELNSHFNAFILSWNHLQGQECNSS